MRDAVDILNEEISRLRQRVVELERRLKQAEDNFAELNIAYTERGERYHEIVAAYNRYADPACDDDKYTFMGTVGRIVEMSDPDDDFTRGEHDL